MPFQHAKLLAVALDEIDFFVDITVTGGIAEPRFGEAVDTQRCIVEQAQPEQGLLADVRRAWLVVEFEENFLAAANVFRNRFDFQRQRRSRLIAEAKRGYPQTAIDSRQQLQSPLHAVPPRVQLIDTKYPRPDVQNFEVRSQWRGIERVQRRYLAVIFDHQFGDIAFEDSGGLQVGRGSEHRRHQQRK